MHGSCGLKSWRHVPVAISRIVISSSSLVGAVGRSQVLLVHACPLRGPLAGATGWTMTRVFVAEGPAYNQLLLGLGVLALTILGSAIWLARILYAWSRKIALLQDALGRREQHAVDLPSLPRTGEQEL